MGSTRRSLLAAVGIVGTTGCTKLAAKTAQKGADDAAVKGADDAAKGADDAEEMDGLDFENMDGVEFNPDSPPSGISAADNLGNELAELDAREWPLESTTSAEETTLSPTEQYNDEYQLAANEYGWVGLDYMLMSFAESDYRGVLLKYEVTVQNRTPIDTILLSRGSFSSFQSGNAVEYYVNGSHLGTTQVAAAVSVPLHDYVLIIDNTSRGAADPVSSAEVRVSVSGELY